MTGATIPYHLRPHKAVDRRLFLDLLGRFERWRALTDYVYISMGGYPLEDHKLIYRIVGISRLIAFDYNKDIVDRQKFNKPADSCHCLHYSSDEIITNFDEILDECGFPTTSPVIVWLDYTEAEQIGEQIREFQSLLNRLKVGDIVRVTVNANPQNLGGGVETKGHAVAKEELRAERFATLRERVNEYLPSWASEDHISEEDYPRVLAGAFAVAALCAMPASSPRNFMPLSIVRYADRQQMLTLTGTVVDRGHEIAVAKLLGLEDWPFTSLAWETVHRLLVPALTIRERLFLERGILTRQAAKLRSELGFQRAAEIDLDDFLDSYRRYYRFYPTLIAAEV
jgi:hypothetical protein